MSSEHWHYSHFTYSRKSILRANSRGFHAGQGATEGTRKGWLISMKLCRPSSSLAMVRLSEIRKLEVGGEGLCDLVGIFDTQFRNNSACLLHKSARRRDIRRRFSLLNEQSSQALYSRKEFFTFLLNQHPSQQN